MSVESRCEEGVGPLHSLSDVYRGQEFGLRIGSLRQKDGLPAVAHVGNKLDEEDAALPNRIQMCKLNLLLNSRGAKLTERACFKCNRVVHYRSGG